MEGSMAAGVEDEDSSSSWMQMAEVMNMLLEAVPKCGSSLVLDEQPMLFDESGSLDQMPHKWINKGKESMEEVEENYSLSSRVVEIDDILNTNRWMEMKKARWTMSPSIYRVPEWLNSMTKREAYQPLVVSLGPFHHGERNLKHMEEHKRWLMLHMVKRSGKPFAQFITAIRRVAEKLQGAYDGLDKKWCGENTDRFVELMVTDGAFLLEMMRVFTNRQSVSDYAPNDPIFGMHSVLSLWARIRSDMILVENQVPLLALQTLEAVRTGTCPSDAEINKLASDFLWHEPSNGESTDILGLHLLDIFHKCFCGPCQTTQSTDLQENSGESTNILGLLPLDIFQKCFCWLSQTRSPDLDRSGQSEILMLSAVELREAGVHIKKSNCQSIKDIDFTNGVLSMPLVKIDDGSERQFFNLMAFERLHFNAGSDATAYMIFMDNIIDSERDVALLRDKKVLKSLLSNDEAAAQLFNSLGKGVTLNPMSKVGHVQWKVAMHCKKPWPKIQASFKHYYMRNPWVFISGVAAVILLALTILQTIYTIVPFYTKN